jgi:hypothetical protein
MSRHIKNFLIPGQAESYIYEDRAGGAENFRDILALQLMNVTGGIVQYGPLAGFNLGTNTTWRRADNGPKLLGFYEQEVCELLARLSRERDTLIDLGGADGYFAVGCLHANLYNECHCYEIVAESRANLAAVAEANSVRDRLQIYEAATSQFPAELTARGVDLSRSVVLIDIEGHEFTVLTEACLSDLSQSHVIVETHPFLAGGGQANYDELVARAGKIFNVHAFQTGARDPSTRPILREHWTDTERWILCSESRATLMTWLYLEPKATA